MTYDLDEGLGILLKKLKDLDIEDNTYIIYMSDNGSVPNIPGAKKYDKSYNYPLVEENGMLLKAEYEFRLLFRGRESKAAQSRNTCFGK